MSTRGTLGGVFASAAVLIIGWQIGAAALGHPATTTSTGPTGATAGSGSNGAPTSGSSGSGSGSPASSTLKDGTFTGASVQTPYGEVQVSIVVASGRISDVATPTLQAYDGRSERINSQAVPLLKREVLQAQSAKVSMISGATFTSRGYLTSLQSALDKAA
ncbi:hypothetical protein GCM10009840_09580 [Pseudolysinimonas kribbensis]|uniref:FMN-binding domain-containing protein n=1 Tax=Pseudolysinimonas kribbensis TaxID=433641 RepID=A0ABQ6K4T1_9MICO|nr:FMN-binding protein [Pseudolysinimonas kribbensis]GMA95369.1 hypothetical protein GCM10025881_21930 [Pseudolysinimonas kribbensis]